MSYTKQDCLDEILDISTNTQLSNQSCRILGVDCSIDSSIMDLSTNISLIDVEDHPMIDLPWIMADGSSGFLLPVTVNKARNTDVTVSLVPSPTDDNGRYIVGMVREHGGTWGLNQMDTGMRARLRLEIPPGTSADTNNYAGLNTQWSSSFPYYQPMKFALSKQSTSNYQCSLYNGNSWIHAGSGMAQASTSTFNSYIGGVFAIPRINDDSITFPWEGHSATKGTILYEAAVSTGAYDSSSGRAVYVPKLYWDANYGKYRPVLYDSNNKNMSSFAIDGLTDSGADHMYYVDRSIGLEPISSFSGTDKSVVTDIYNNPNYTFFVRFNAYRYQGNITIFNTTQGTSGTRMVQENWNSGSSHYTYLYFYENANNNVRIYSDTTSSSRINSCVSWNMKTNSSNVSRQNISVNTTTSFWSKTNYSCAKNSLSDRGNIILTYSQYNFIYWFMVLDENNEMIHYLVPCTYNGDVVYYDVLTKTIYS